MGVEHTGDVHLTLALLLGSLSDLLFLLVEEEVEGVLAGELANLNQEVSDVLAEQRQVLVHREEAFHEDLDLGTEDVNKDSGKRTISYI